MAYNILIVDDSATTRAVIEKTINISGVATNEIYQAANGKDALHVLESNWVDLIFSDINMPVMGGLEMVERMHEDGLLKTIPVIIVSTDGNATRIEQLKSRGVRAYIRKPFTPELLKGVIDEILEASDE